MTLDELIELSRYHATTPEERRAQAISFAYGNAAIENPDITREIIERQYDLLHRGSQ